MFRRRRPLMAAAMIGGVAHHAGRASAQNQQREEDEQARLDALEYQAAAAQPAAPAGPSDLAAKLTELKSLADQGVLTEDEFTAAKQKLLAG
jgi:putative oligomerization/nucleic acid binding protein